MMDEEIVFKGEWYLPDNWDKRVTGTLTYRPYDDFSELELFGHIADYRKIKHFDIILGRTLEGVEISLYRCIVGQFKRNLNSYKTEKIYYSKLKVECIFSGALISKEEDLVFHKIEAEVYNLENWVGKQGFSDNTVDYGNEIIFNYQKPDPIHFQINEKIDGEISFSIKSKEYQPAKNEYNFTQLTELSFKSGDSLFFEELVQVLNKFQDFLVMALYTHTNAFNIELYSKHLNIIHSIANGEVKIPKAIKLYSKRAKKIERIKPKLYFELLFTYDDIHDIFPVIIKKWYENYEKVSDSFRLFFYQFYISDRYLNGLFLNLAQAIESFHYHLYPDKKLIETREFKKLKKILKEQTTDDIYGWVSPQISNNLHLDTRLSELIETHCNDVLLNYIGDIDLFKRNIKNTRNYYTHFNPDLKNKALKGYDLLDLYIKLRLFLISAFLIESGFDKKLVNELFKKNSYKVFSVYM